MRTDRDDGPNEAAGPASQWCAVGWDGLIALIGLAVLMLGVPLGLVVVLVCWTTLSLRKSMRSWSRAGSRDH